VASSQPSVQARRSGGVVVPKAPRWYQRLGALLVFLLVRGVSATLRYRWDDRSGYFNGPSPGAAIYCVWHNRLGLCLEAYRLYVRRRVHTPGMAAIVSASRDGALLAAILECFKVQPVRGSTSRRGPQALLELTGWCERGYDLAITPDGPRGPRYVVQDGVMSLAQVTGLPITPASYYLSWKICAKSWDRFQVPLPFSRCEVVLAKPVHVPRNASDQEREALRQELEQTLREITRD
jgi:lysophospholipid acyltransferase (LPLAT)-like uncharacterized protein